MNKWSFSKLTSHKGHPKEPLSKKYTWHTDVLHCDNNDTSFDWSHAFRSAWDPLFSLDKTPINTCLHDLINKQLHHDLIMRGWSTEVAVWNIYCRNHPETTSTCHCKPSAMTWNCLFSSRVLELKGSKVLVLGPSIYTVEVGSLHTPKPNTFKLSFSQFLTFNPSTKFIVLGQLGSPLYFKNVKCQNNTRENDLFQLLFLSSHS